MSTWGNSEREHQEEVEGSTMEVERVGGRSERQQEEAQEAGGEVDGGRRREQAVGKEVDGCRGDKCDCRGGGVVGGPMQYGGGSENFLPT
ncbi:hypothetical protein Ancab_012728 [Ancistrocladus abbreviatus]